MESSVTKGLKEKAIFEKQEAELTGEQKEIRQQAKARLEKMERDLSPEEWKKAHLDLQRKHWQRKLEPAESDRKARTNDFEQAKDAQQNLEEKYSKTVKYLENASRELSYINNVMKFGCSATVFGVDPIDKIDSSKIPTLMETYGAEQLRSTMSSKTALETMMREQLQICDQLTSCSEKKNAAAVETYKAERALQLAQHHENYIKSMLSRMPKGDEIKKGS